MHIISEYRDVLDPDVAIGGDMAGHEKTLKINIGTCLNMIHRMHAAGAGAVIGRASMQEVKKSFKEINRHVGKQRALKECNLPSCKMTYVSQIGLSHRGYVNDAGDIVKQSEMKCCGGCRIAYYCCAAHQRADWKGGHKKVCKQLQRLENEREKEKAANATSVEHPKMVALRKELLAAIECGDHFAVTGFMERLTGLKESVTKAELQALCGEMLASFGAKLQEEPDDASTMD
mgnify:CR=1 FL=1